MNSYFSSTAYSNLKNINAIGQNSQLIYKILENQRKAWNKQKSHVAAQTKHWFGQDVVYFVTVFLFCFKKTLSFEKQIRW